MNQPTALDWAAIRQQYPKAFEALRVWLSESDRWTMRDVFYVENHLGLNDRFHSTKDDRDLYKFFDDHGVFVYPNVTPVRDGKADFYACIEFAGSSGEDIIGPFDTRLAAETAGFTAAFGVLEKQLTGESKNQKQG